MTCQLPYHKSKDNLTSFLFETGAISEVGNNILDLNLFRQVNKQIENDLNNSYGIQASPFIEDDLTGSQTFYTNDKVFERIDEVRKELGLYEDRIAGSYVQGETEFIPPNEHISYKMKVIQALESSNVREPNLSPDKFQGFINDITKQGVSAQQLTLLKESVNRLKETKDKITKQDLITDLLSSASYVVEVNTAMKTYGRAEQMEDEDYETRISRKKTSSQPIPTDHYFQLNVPGGTNYTENEIRTPGITPSIKGHALFSTDQGIGWFRSDDKTITENRTNKAAAEAFGLEEEEGTIPVVVGVSKTRRILETQSDLFQKGRDKDDLVTTDHTLLSDEDYINSSYYKSEDGKYYFYDVHSYDIHTPSTYEITKEQYDNRFSTIEKRKSKPENKFLQLLNKDNQWVKFFLKSIVQDSAKRGYDTVVFPTGDTASKIEGHETLEQFVKNKEEAIVTLNRREKEVKELISKQSFNLDDVFYKRGNNEDPYIVDGDAVTEETFNELLDTAISFRLGNIERSRNQFQQEIEMAQQDFGKLRAIWKFYEETVGNILKKEYKNIERITDEYGNGWWSIPIVRERDLTDIMFQKTPVTNKEITPELYQTLVNFVKKVNPDFRIEVIDDLLASKGVYGLVDFKRFLIQLNQGNQSAMAEETAHVFFELMEDSNPLKQRMLSEITNTRIYKQTVKEYREIYGNDTKRLKSEAAAKLISLYLTDKTLAKKMSGSDSLWENIQRWMSDFFKWIKGRPKTFSSFLESAEKIVNLDTSGLHLDKAYTLEEMYSLGDYIEKIKILESVRNTNVAGLDMLYFNLNDTLFNYKDYPGTSDEKRKFLFDAARTAERDRYYQNVSLTTLGRELKDKVRFIGSEKVTIYTQMYVSPALETRLRNEFGNIKIERVNVTQTIEDEDGNVIKEIQTNSLQEVLDRDGYSKMLIVDNGKPTLDKPYNIVKYNERKANYDTLERRIEREKQKEDRDKVTQGFLDELNRVNEYKEGSVTEQVMKTFKLIKGELLDIEKTERILEGMGDEEVSKLFRDEYGNLGLPLKNIDAAKKLIEETDRYGDALKQFLATIEGTIGFFKERNDNGYQVTKDLIEKGDLESLERAIYELSKITKIGTAWQEYIKDFRKLIKDVPNTSTVDSLLGELDTQIQRTKDIAHDLNIKVLSERLSNEFAAYNWTKEARASEIQEKINNSQDPEEIKRYERELKSLKNKGVEDVSRILMGEVPDISSLTVWIKTLYNSRDPLVGSISKLLQKAFAQVETKELQRGQEMGIALREVQEQHSLTNKDLEELLVVEKTPVFNSETGEYELKDRYAYMNPWEKRHEYDEKKKPYLESRDKYIKAKQDKDPNLDSIRAEYLEQKKIFEDWETTNWHRPYTEEYYRRYDALKNENPGLFETLKTESDLIWSDINSKSLLLRGETNPEQKEILNSQIRDLRRELSQIKSEVYFDGSPKVGLDLEKAKLAQRKSEIDNEVHDWSIDNKTFEQDFTIFLNTLGIEDDLRETYLALLSGQDNYSKLFQEIKSTAPYELIDWMDSNTLIRYSQEWYDQRSKITEEISDISNRLSQAYGQTERVDLKETWENLINISSPYRDEDRVLDGSVTSPQVQERILKYERQIEDIKKLVREEREGTYGPEIKALKNQLSRKIEELNEIQNKQTTEAYNDTFVELAESVGMVEEFNRLHPDLYFGYNSRLDVLINTNEFQDFLKDKDNVFTQWYYRNHLTKSYRDSFGQEHFTISPTYLWMKIEPKDDKHILTVPSYRYSERIVKPEYQTVKENWVTWNPITYRWLPKSETYFNPAYKTLQNRQDSKGIGLRKALRLLTDYHLKTQETAPKEARLEFGVPYVQKRGLEASGNYFKNIYNEFTDKDNRFEEGEGNFDESIQPESKKGIKNRIISWINGFIGEEEKEEETPETIKKYTRIAVPYSHYMNIEDVTKDVVFSTTAFGFSTSKATKMMHTLPTFKLIEDVLQNNEVTKDKNGRPVSNNAHRLKAVQFAQNHYIYGVNKQYELGEHGKTIDKGLTWMRKINTTGSLAWPFGIANTLKNNLQGRLQNLIGSKFGDWSSNKSMRKAAGNFNTNYFKYLSEIESAPDKRSLDYHIITFFNPHQMGDIAFNLHKGGRNRIMQDKHMFIMNESMEFAISTNLLYGHLYHVKVKKGDEIKDLYSILKYENGIKAEEGWVDYKTGRPVDEDYLLDTKLAHKTAAEYVQGKIGDKTLLGTYTIGQALLYFKNWLIPMIRRRFDSKKENYMVGEDIEGYWRTFLRVNLTMMRDLMKDGKMYWHTFSPEEKRNYITTLNEIAFVIISSLLIGLVYGFDADDKDKYKKLKENSYAENLTLLIVLQAKAETEMLTFMPFFNVESQAVPPVLTELPKVIMNPTIGFSLVNDLWKTINAGYGLAMGDEGAYYQMNQPAYNIQKGDLKMNHYLLKFAQLDNIIYSVENPEGKLAITINMMKK